MTPRVLHVLAAVSVGAAAVGFMAGASPDPSMKALSWQPRAAARTTGDGRMPAYRDMASRERRVSDRISPIPGAGVVPEPRDREARRAFDGAPPVVPHPIDELGAPACLSCHAEGAVIEGKVASRISHARYESCVQCHAPAREKAFDGAAVVAKESAFVPFRARGGGPRAYRGAPPMIPHRTLMRSECASCHGVAGPNPLRTPHPERQSCVQCHAPSAELDQSGAAR